MKKKLLLLLLIPVLLLITGCGETKEKEVKIDDTKKIVLKDEGFGYTTTFSYDKKEKYSDVEEEKDNGRSTQITFENEELDLQFSMYYTDMSSNAYKSTQEARKKQKYYREYKFGKYDAYTYGEYGSGLYVSILLETGEDDMAKILFVSIDRLDSDENVVVADVVEEETVQELFNSIDLKKE